MTIADRLEKIERHLDQQNKLLRMQLFAPLKVKDVAVLLNLSEPHIRHLVCDRAIPHYKNERGGVHFIKEELEEWMKGQRIPTKEEIAAEARRYCANNPR